MALHQIEKKIAKRKITPSSVKDEDNLDVQASQNGSRSASPLHPDGATNPVEKLPSGSRPTSAASKHSEAAISRPMSPLAKPAAAEDTRPSSAASRPITTTSRPTSAVTRPTSAAIRPTSAASLKAADGDPTMDAFLASSSRPATATSVRDPMGSRATLQSREAWPETVDEDKDSGTEKEYADQVNDNDADDMLSSQISLRPETQCAIKPEADNMSNAYVPYLYAKGCVAKIVEDMKAMMLRHQKITHDIERNYRSIEDETQAQFNMFVRRLKTSHFDKSTEFVQIIRLHQADLRRKQSHWDNSLYSLSDKNKQLIRDKKRLLIINKVEGDRLRTERDDAEINLKEQFNKDRENFLIERNELNETIEELRKRPEGSSTVVGGALVAVSDLSEEERKRMEEERNSLASERRKMREEILVMQDERAKNSTEQQRLHEDKLTLQADLNAANKETALMDAKYHSVVAQVGDISLLRAENKAYAALIAALLPMAAVKTDEDRKLCEEKIKKGKEDKAMMEEQRSMIEADILAWEAQFKKENSRVATEADRTDSARESYSSLDETKAMLTSLEILITTLEKLKAGKVPPVPVIAPVPIVLHEPEVKIVEVTVTDPETENKLKHAQLDNNKLRTEVDHAAQERSKLQDELSEFQTQLSDARAQISQLEAQVKVLEEELAAARIAAAVGGAVGAGGATVAGVQELQEKDAELKASEKRVKQMEKDMKKLLKVHSKQVNSDDSMTAKLLLKIVIGQAHGVHGMVNPAAEIITTRLEEAEAELKEATNHNAAAQQDLHDWETGFCEENGREPTRKDREYDSTASELVEISKKASQSVKHSDMLIIALQMLCTGIIPDKLRADGGDMVNESELDELEAKISELEDQQQSLEEEKGELSTTNKELNDLILQLQTELSDAQLMIGDGGGTSSRPVTAKGKGNDKELQARMRELKNENKNLQAKCKQLESELKKASKVGIGPEAEKTHKRHEKILKELEKKFEMEKKKCAKHEENVKKKEEDIVSKDRTLREKEAEIAKLMGELSTIGVAAKEGANAMQKVKDLEKEVKTLTKENKTLSDNFNSERVLRKKYYNIIEDMKGKIRVYCRVRPLSNGEKQRGSTEVCKSADEYTIAVQSSRGVKEFQFDQIFMPDSSQEKVFDDTNMLIQSAVDGYNVCIFAYGQTGSGKTFTIIGDQNKKFPGIAPRAFDKVFELLEENKSKFTYKVSCYMLELYNDKLLDLFSKGNEDKLDIKKDQKGMVVVSGADIKSAKDSKELYALFEKGSLTRHTACTNMNAESSRSHLIISIILETTNKSSGQVLKGKLSLVDLAGSERASKTGATPEQLKEAMSINKSLSALGDVISALSSDQSFIPYRNNKLTMLMQDSIGGNAKTLMFVNVSPADYNCDETVISLTYASRVKLITNDASKNADNKEIARLKSVIQKMRKGEAVAEEVAEVE